MNLLARYKRNKTVFQADYWKNGWFSDITAYCTALQPLFMKYFNHTKLVTGESYSSH
jgi:hypothetical protein